MSSSHILIEAREQQIIRTDQMCPLSHSAASETETISPQNPSSSHLDESSSGNNKHRLPPSSDVDDSSLGGDFAAMSMPSSTSTSSGDRKRTTTTITTITMSGETTRRRKREVQERRVKFHGRTRVYLIQTLDEMSEEEVRCTWRTEDDEADTQSEIVQTVRMMRRSGGLADGDGDGDIDVENDITCRGLEHLGTADAVVERKERKANQLHAVLDEQDRQWDNPHLPPDEDRIAHIATTRAASSVETAATVAARDAAFVRRFVGTSTSITTMVTADHSARFIGNNGDVSSSSLRSLRSAPTGAAAVPARRPARSRSADPMSRPHQQQQVGPPERPARRSSLGSEHGYRVRARSKSVETAATTATTSNNGSCRSLGSSRSTACFTNG
mmetsp:Transcript_34727/g.76276  ORF Transcript_34727/g.76276 Transcript_34727/m.76276 type:complete len:386 (+) Transcript_34727:339-1496(+)